METTAADDQARAPGPPFQPQERQLYVLLIVLLAAYCLPIFLVTILAGREILYSTIDGMIGTNLIKPLQKVAADQSRYAGSIKNLLVPVATAITAANYKTIDLTRWGSALFLIPLLGVLACVANALMFDIRVDTAVIPDADKAVPLISNMFIETATTLSGYVMMLVGLKSTQK
ncbi:hypothetical protein NKJ66_27145 [Mesorhizobium sp. M0078]|uniref:hypothetical protein n=1 Tax=Mesorhizobium sp. M0078 TaxID=2956871 RepID=UPI00333D5F85